MNHVLDFFAGWSLTCIRFILSIVLVLAFYQPVVAQQRSICAISPCFPCPSLNDATVVSKSISRQGEFSTSQTKFLGGAGTAGGNNCASPTTAKLEEEVLFEATIEVNPQDIGKQANILFIVAQEPLPKPYDGGVDTVYSVIDEHSEGSPIDLYANVDVWMAQLKPYMSGVTLKERMRIDLGAWQFSKASQYYIFVGYQLNDGTIVYNFAPIIVETLDPNLEIQYSPITEPTVDLAMVAKAGDEVLGIFGKKDADGRLITIEGLTFGSQSDKTKNLTIELDSNYFPKKIVFPDKSSVEFNNYNDNGATASYRNANGVVVNQTPVTLPMDKIKKAAAAAKKYTESPQPTIGNPVPSLLGGTASPTDSNCFEVMTAFHDMADNLLWGAFQLASAISCAVAVAEAILTGGLAIPLAAWACSSIVLNGVDHIANALTDGHSPFERLNNANSLVSGAVACFRRDWGGCAQTVAEQFTGVALDAFDPKKICKNVSCQDAENPALEQWCINTAHRPYNQGCNVYAVDGDHIRTIAEMNKLANECNAVPNSCVHLKLNYAFNCQSTLKCNHTCDPHKVY